MPKSKGGDRHSKAVSVDLIRDPKKKARREARNALQQFDLALELVQDWLRPNRKFRLLTSQILQLHEAALKGLSLYAGTCRNSPVKINKSKHKPPASHMVPLLAQEMCDYVNKNWRRNAIHLCAYVMWRMNWIHPFADGNGRTSRITSYMVLCVRLGYVVPGTNTVPEQIAANKDPYYKALEAADAAWKKGRVDVSAMEKMLQSMLATQLVQIYKQASGRKASNKKGRKLH